MDMLIEGLGMTAESMQTTQLPRGWVYDQDDADRNPLEDDKCGCLIRPSSSNGRSLKTTADDLNYSALERFPFFVVCTIATGRRLGYPCHTLTEAHAKFNAIAEVMFGSQPLAVA